MFKELAAILGVDTNLKLSISPVADGNLTVIVEPQSTSGKTPALTPLSLIASPEELDAEFPGILAQYGAKRLSLTEQMQQSLAAMEEVAKQTIEAEKAKTPKAKAARTTPAPAAKGLTEDRTEVKDALAASGAKPLQAKAFPGSNTLDLFS